jgi:acyl-coenzyme A thioesterase PaaI-like protein
MRKEEPSFALDESYTKCFACGKDNPIGLKLKFRQDGEVARSEFTPGEFHQGWRNIVHGGILCTLLDEAMGYATIFQGLSCITAESKVRFKKLVPVGEPLFITGAITKRARKLIWTRAGISLEDGTKVAEATATMWIVDQKETSA